MDNLPANTPETSIDHDTRQEMNSPQPGNKMRASSGYLFMVEQIQNHGELNEALSAPMNYMNMQWVTCMKVAIGLIDTETKTPEKMVEIFDNLLGLAKYLYDQGFPGAADELCLRLRNLLKAAESLFDNDRINHLKNIEWVTNAPMDVSGAASKSAPREMNLDFLQFRDKRCIGSGGYGDVYEGKFYGTEVLIKIVANERSQKRLFQKTKTIMAVIRHQLIAPFLAFFPTLHQDIFVMPKDNYRDMKNVSESDFIFDINDFKVVAAQICLAVMFLHRRGIVHFDIKPSNIIMNDHGRVKLIDFDLCDFRYGNFREEYGSMFSEACKFDLNIRYTGTAAFAAPELRRGEPVGRSADWYAVGSSLRFIRRSMRELEGSTSKLTLDNLVDGLRKGKKSVRLGTESVLQILEHPFFEGLDWDKLENGTFEFRKLDSFPDHAKTLISTKPRREIEPGSDDHIAPLNFFMTPMFRTVTEEFLQV